MVRIRRKHAQFAIQSGLALHQFQKILLLKSFSCLIIILLGPHIFNQNWNKSRKNRLFTLLLGPKYVNEQQTVLRERDNSRTSAPRWEKIASTVVRHMFWTKYECICFQNLTIICSFKKPFLFMALFSIVAYDNHLILVQKNPTIFCLFEF